jgi:hypothetical protein
MTVEAIKAEIEHLSPEGKAALAAWTVEQDSMSWDEQMRRPAARAWLSWKRWTRNSAKAA